MGGGSFHSHHRMNRGRYVHMHLARGRHSLIARRAGAYFAQQRDYRHIPVHLALTHAANADAANLHQPSNNTLHPRSRRRLRRDFDRRRSFASHARGASRCAAHGDDGRTRQAGGHVDDAGGRHADRRGAGARDDAQEALAKLAGQPVDAKIAGALADPFMAQDYYRDRAPDYLAKEFGPQFALAAAKLAPGSWQGPIQSGFGWHLVFVDTVIPGRVPSFEESEADVRTAWLGEQKALAWEKSYKGMRANYTVLLPGPPASAADSPSSQLTKEPAPAGAASK